MRYFKRFWPVVPALAGGLALVLATTSPATAVDIATCPFTITSPGIYDVVADLTCAPENGITIFPGASGALLRLNGHTLTGPNNGLGWGIYVNAVGVNIQGPGVVRQFAYGIALIGATGIVVQGVTARENAGPGSGYGFYFKYSNGNQIIDCATSENGRYGMWLYDSSANVFVNATVTDEDTGIFVTSSSLNNQIIRSANNQIITSNISNYNRNGIRLDYGTGGTTLVKNTVSGGPSYYGIAILGRANVVQGNTVNNNRYGIIIGGNQNIVVANTAMGNNLLDLEDDHPDCDSNVWAANTFGTSSQACIH